MRAAHSTTDVMDAGQTAVYDEMLRDERLSDGEKDMIATATLEMERRLLAFL